MDKDQFNSVDKKLDLVVNLLAAQMIQGKDYRQQLEILDAVGMKTKVIALLTGKTENNVKVTLHLIKKKHGKKELKEDNVDNEAAQ